MAQRRRAVTITELVIVVLIMGIMMAAAAPTFYNSLQHHRVESAARRLKADLKLARQTARLKSATQTVTFVGSVYTLGADIAALDRPQEGYWVDLDESPYDVSGVAADFNSTQTVSFDGYGKPTSGGTVVLTVNGHSCTVTLDGETGDITVSSVQSVANAIPVDGI